MRYKAAKAAPASAADKVFEWVNGLAEPANFKMQLDPVGVGAAHLGNLLAFFDTLVFLDQHRLVVGVGG